MSTIKTQTDTNPTICIDQGCRRVFASLLCKLFLTGSILLATLLICFLYAKRDVYNRELEILLALERNQFCLYHTLKCLCSDFTSSEGSSVKKLASDLFLNIV
ncbi:hypothetical protein KIL84_001091 [Mauremys mutica]|uniref:Uncharacterized protein n=1 Tax=Mauremys mutica TaxID=74926 RepID=A0A9D3WYH2_9SAUR|nr:hypothetical protein KIL84_001091 [Mauremys mutica]